MNDKRKEKYKQQFVEAGLMTEDEEMVDYIQCQHHVKKLGMGQWQQGWICFTDRKILYPLPLLSDKKALLIPYSSIRSLGKCTQSLLPLGIIVTYQDPETNEQKEERFSMAKRDNWIAFLTEKAGL